ncbi:transcription elongation factor A protein 2-like isoform X2 [Carassius gibelio]|uniref:transcription elongation factor A protein 2-like isoform X2 n=1 Tax=Carassius gibelio TaxID=101364 RepID=UPI002278C472|nr:transcription elongation factor A protein 2-like isoform X2 [Carassius gibelio]
MQCGSRAQMRRCTHCPNRSSRPGRNCWMDLRVNWRRRQKEYLPSSPHLLKTILDPATPVTRRRRRKRPPPLSPPDSPPFHLHLSRRTVCAINAEICWWRPCRLMEFKSTDMKYKTRLRSRISNLKDQKNPDLCQDVLCGNISADRIASMNAEEMASAELKEIRKALIKESILEHQLSKVCGTETDMFICGKCKGKNCNYTQVQTRSAGEPMTTFVLCNECGNRWKIRPHSLLIGENAANHRPAHILKSAFHGRETRQRSSQASQKSMFSSLYSVRRNSRNLFRPAGFFISLSKDCAHCLISSIVGLGLIERDREREREREREKLGSHGKGSSLVSWAFLRSRLSSSLLTVRLEGGKMALRNNSSA